MVLVRKNGNRGDYSSPQANKAFLMNV